MLFFAGLTLAIVHVLFAIWLITDISCHFLADCHSKWAWKDFIDLAGILATLLTAIVAVWIATYGQRKAIEREERAYKETNESDEKVRRRKELSARAALPFVLVELTEYAKDCLNILKYNYPENDEVAKFEHGTIVPNIPKGAIRIIQDCVEHAETEVVFALYGLVEKLQIQNSRLKSYVTGTELILRHNFDSAIFDVVSINVELNRMFEFARRRSETIAEPSDVLRTLTMDIAFCDEDKYASLLSLIDLRKR